MKSKHIKQIGQVYHEWKAETGLSAVVSTAEAAKNDFNLSPSRYVATGGAEEVLPLEEAVVLLQEAEEERAEADRELDEVLAQPRVRGIGGMAEANLHDSDSGRCRRTHRPEAGECSTQRVHYAQTDR